MANDGASLEALRGILEAFNAHDLDGVMAFFADDCVLEMPRGPDPWGTRAFGKAAVRSLLSTRFSGIPDVSYEDATHLVAGHVGISQWTLRGTSSSGERIEVRGCDLYTFSRGKIVKKDSYWKIRERANR
jgi:ketosteroid isomerase-like protein